VAKRSGLSSDDIRLARPLFDKLLDMPSLAPLFEAAVTFGPNDPAVGLARWHGVGLRSTHAGAGSSPPPQIVGANLLASN